MEPWVEKYRPTSLEGIILDETNSRVLNNILKKNEFPNILIYGPPGTGKTTTIINIIQAFQQQNNEVYKDLVIHLNASDDRGIETIRNQIRDFVKAGTLLGKGTKFIILDEVDAMTKAAQSALKNLIQDYSHVCRFCLICNYISKVELSLKMHFLVLKMCQLPRDETKKMLKRICKEEKILIHPGEYDKMIDFYQSDVRSMINALQTRQRLKKNEAFLGQQAIKDFLNKIKKYGPNESAGDSTSINGYPKHLMYKMLFNYNIDKYNLVLAIFRFLLNISFDTDTDTDTDNESNSKNVTLGLIIDTMCEIIHPNLMDSPCFDDFLFKKTLHIIKKLPDVILTC